MQAWRRCAPPPVSGRSVVPGGADRAVSSPEPPSARPVLCLGDALIDIIATDRVRSLVEADSFVARNGGAPANVAVALSRLGIPAAFCGAVGNDPFGRRLVAGLTEERVDTSRVLEREAATTIAFAWKDEQGDGQFWLLRNADATLSPDDVTIANIEAAAAIVVGSVALAAEPSRAAVNDAVHLATRANVPVCFDVNLRPTLWPDLTMAQGACQPILINASLLKLSLDDARGLLNTGDHPATIVRELAETTRAPIIVLTDGARGCWYLADDGNVQHVPAVPVEAVEPTGAGDAFMAALISRLLSRNWSVPDERDIRFAAAAGALTTMRPGAWDGLPTATEVEAFVNGASPVDR